MAFQKIINLNINKGNQEKLEKEKEFSINKKSLSSPYNYYLVVTDMEIFKKIDNVMKGNATTYKYKEKFGVLPVKHKVVTDFYIDDD